MTAKSSGENKQATEEYVQYNTIYIVLKQVKQFCVTLRDTLDMHM